MALNNWLNRITKRFIIDTSPATMINNFNGLSDWIYDPDMSAVTGVSSVYWTIIGDTVSEMSQSEKDAVDAANLAAARDFVASQIDEMESMLRQYIKISGIENNILRVKLGLEPRTFEQLKTAIRDGLGS